MHLIKKENNVFKDDKTVIWWALNQWANHIETGSMSLSKQDAINMDDKEALLNYARLTEEQSQFIGRLHKLADKALKGEI